MAFERCTFETQLDLCNSWYDRFQSCRNCVQSNFEAEHIILQQNFLWTIARFVDQTERTIWKIFIQFYPIGSFTFMLLSFWTKRFVRASLNLSAMLILTVMFAVSMDYSPKSYVPQLCKFKMNCSMDFIMQQIVPIFSFNFHIQ